MSEFLKEAVHSTYVLAETVLAGVGFHYGRIPALLRAAIESAFSAGALMALFVQARSSKGSIYPLAMCSCRTRIRASIIQLTLLIFGTWQAGLGDWAKTFRGNVFLIDYNTWDSEPLAGQKDEPVKSALETTLVDAAAELVEYIGNESEPSGPKPILEAAFSKLLRDLRHGQLDETLGRLTSLSPDSKSEIKAALEKADAVIAIDVATLDASPQISGFRQQELYDYMLKKIQERGPDYLIPVHPSASFKEALDKLRPVFARVHRYLELKSGNHHLYWAPLALRWMRGEPLPLIIDEAIKYHKRQGKSRSNRTVIREVLTDVESDLRFRYVNLLGCYIAVLKKALIDSSHPGSVLKIPALTLYLRTWRSFSDHNSVHELRTVAAYCGRPRRPYSKQGHGRGFRGSLSSAATIRIS